MADFNYNSKNKDKMVSVMGVGVLPALAVRTKRGHFDSSEHYRFAVCEPMGGFDKVSLEHLVKSAIAYQATLDHLQNGLDNLCKLINDNS